MYLGVDCGTQSTKVVVLDGERLEILGEAARPHRMIQGERGRREQAPSDWVAAFEAALAQALEEAGVDGGAVRAIGVSGQQHGMVALDAAGQPVHPGKLWCDTESVRENETLIAALGGERGCLERLGLVLQTGYTASKIAWLRGHHFDAYKRIETLFLPHDYLNYHLTGERVAEYGDASGTGYFDTRRRCWSLDTFALIAPELDPARVLPRLLEPQAPAGRLRPELARRLGLAPGVVVSAGGGDNMMAAIGTGNIAPGTMTISLGTSGTLYAAAPRPAISGNGLVANFCASHGGWLPLICTMNLTSATTLVRELLGYDVARFNAAANQAPIGADGIKVLAFFNGERVPPLPEASATFEGLASHNFIPSNLCRAVMEGATFGLRYGFDELVRLTGHPRRVRLVGGGAKSAVWRRMVSEVMDVELACPEINEAAAFGAALQALWCERWQAGERLALESLCERAVTLREETLTRPDRARVARYTEAYAGYLDLLRRRHPAVQAD